MSRSEYQMTRKEVAAHLSQQEGRRITPRMVELEEARAIEKLYVGLRHLLEGGKDAVNLCGVDCCPAD